MISLKRVKTFEKGLYFRNGEFQNILNKGLHSFYTPFVKEKVDIISVCDIQLIHAEKDSIVKSGMLDEKESIVLDIKDDQRALIWKDGRFETILGPGLHVIWTVFYEIDIEIVETDAIRFEHKYIDFILNTESSKNYLDEFVVEEGFVGLFFKNSKFIEKLNPGRYAFWKNAGKVKLYHKDLREQSEDVGGQEIMTADKVTLRVNAIVHYQIEDVLKSVTKVDDLAQALYQESQLILRSVIGTRELDALLADKNLVSKELVENLSEKVTDFGLKISSFGIKDLILPGEMKDLLNKVIEARKVAEANLISRREEVAAMRSQANTARMLEDNPTLMRLKELEVLEKVAESSKLQVLLGDKGLTEKVVNLL